MKTAKQYVLTGIIACTTALAGAETNQQAAIRQPEPLAAYVPEAIVEKSRIRSDDPTPAFRWLKHDLKLASSNLDLPRMKPTESERWDRFEEEFKPKEQYDSVVQDRISGAKYQLDKTVFALDQFVTRVEEALKFDYRFRDNTAAVSADRQERRTRRTYDSIWDDVMDNARIRSDVDLGLSKAFIGIRLEFPFGN